MNIKIILIITVILITYFEGVGQSKYDTIVYCSSQHSKLEFQLGNAEMHLFEVNETDISIRNGEIEKNKQSTDTIGIKYLKLDDVNDSYEIKLSDKAWRKILFGRQCKYLEDQMENYPDFILQRNKITNKLSFLEPEIVGRFIKNNYQKRIECIASAEDKFMKKHLIRWINMIENDSINEFANSCSSHFLPVFSLYDLIAPTNFQDTLVCKISSTQTEVSNEFSYQINKLLNSDSTITYHYTDCVDKANPVINQFVEKLYKPFKKHHAKEEKIINEIRLESMKSEDKSTIELSKTREFKRYLRVMESFMLDSNLKPKFSFYNYEIKRITTSNE